MWRRHAEAFIPSQLHRHQDQEEPKRDEYPELPAAEVLFFIRAGGRDLDGFGMIWQYLDIFGLFMFILFYFGYFGIFCDYYGILLIIID